MSYPDLNDRFSQQIIEKTRNQIEDFKKESFIWSEVLQSTFMQKGFSPYATQQNVMEKFAYPILKEWDYLLKSMYPQMVRHRISSNHMAVFSLSEMNDAELYFVCGLMSYEVFKYSEATSCKKAEEKARSVNRQRKLSFQQLDSLSPLSFYPNIVDLFEIMLNRPEDSLQIPLCKEYIQYVDNIRKASQLLKAAHLPMHQAVKKRKYALENWCIPNDLNQTRYNILHHMVQIRNSFYAESEPKSSNALNILLSLLSKQFYLDQVAVLKTLPFNRRDPLLAERAKVSAQLLTDVLGPQRFHVRRDFDKHLADCAIWVHQMILDNPNLPDVFNMENASCFKKNIRDFMSPLFRKNSPTSLFHLKNQKERE